MLAFRAAGLGLCMMPIFTVGMSSVPFSNVIRQTSSALGGAAFTALVTRQEAQQFVDRAALLPATSSIPNLGSSALPGWLGVWALDQQTQLRTFTDAVDLLFIVVAILTAAGIILGLFLPSKNTPATSADRDRNTEVRSEEAPLLTPATIGPSMQSAETAEDSPSRPEATNV